MTSTLAEVMVLKTDTKNRVRTPRERRETLLDEFERSGLSGARFAALIGIKYQTFANWRQKRRRDRRGAGEMSEPCVVRGEANGSAVRWLEAVAAPKRPGQPGSLRVHLPGGAHVEIADRSQAMLAAELLRVLAISSAL